jgi:hypothetical protein
VDEERYIRWTFIEKLLFQRLHCKNPCRVCLEGEREFSFGESERERDARRRDGDKERERGVKVRSRCSPQQ